MRRLDTRDTSGTPGTPDLADDRTRLGRTSTAERVADVLRERITDGYFKPGEQLPEETITGALEISRNTLREAFRLLAHNRLVVHKLNRGVFVREITPEDVVDIYHLRRLLECGAVRTVTARPPDFETIAAPVGDGERAARHGDWHAVGTADVRFHQALTALAGSRRLDDLMAVTFAELRLVFQTMPDTRAFHEPYLRRNREILTELEAGDGAAAEQLLAAYLHDAEKQLLAQLAGSSP